MPYTDFEVETLARYLHLAPPQIIKLAERGDLPGRKVGGEGKCSKPDIHHWFEQRIGLSDEEQLLHVEHVLQKSLPEEDQEHVRISELLPVEAIAIPLHARTRNSVIESMVELAAGTGLLWDPKEMGEAVRSREDMHPTALENGVALLHPRRPMAKILSQPFLALGVTVTGIPFGGASSLTDVFFLICSTDDRVHLRVLARLSRLLTAPGFLNGLHQATDAIAVHQLILDAEEKL
jgi:nitrogen PTS system EIIA component